MDGERPEVGAPLEAAQLRELARKNFAESTAVFEALPEEQRSKLLSELLNNFYTRIPGGYNRIEATEDPDADTTETVLDRGKRPVRMSEVRFAQSLRQFEATVDAALEKAGIDLAQIKEKNNALAEATLRQVPMNAVELAEMAPQMERAAALRLELNALLYGVYKALREAGYSYDDVA